MAPIPKPAPPLPEPEAAPQPPSRPEYPLASLGSLLSTAAAAVAARSQTPVELAAHHVLTLAAMAAQKRADVRLPTGEVRPISCFFATLLPTAERADFANRLTVEAAHRAEERLTAMAKAITGERILRLDLFFAPTTPAPRDRYRRPPRMAGFFPSRADELIQPGKHRRAECASLAALWDGIVMPNGMLPPYFPRLSLHLVCTRRDGRAFLGDPMLTNAGLLSRVLVVEPASRIGGRVWHVAPDDTPPVEFAALIERLGELIPPPATAGTRALTFSTPAADLWLDFAREVELAMAPGGAFAAIPAFADRLPEHAARLAAVIALLEGDTRAELGVPEIERGLSLARFYAAESLRLHELAPPALTTAEQADLLKEWLLRRHCGKQVSLREICRSGPPAVRRAKIAADIMRNLEMGDLLTPAAGVERTGEAPRTRETRSWRVAGMSRDVA